MAKVNTALLACRGAANLLQTVHLPQLTPWPTLHQQSTMMCSVLMPLTMSTHLRQALHCLLPPPPLDHQWQLQPMHRHLHVRICQMMAQLQLLEPQDLVFARFRCLRLHIMG